MFWSNADAVWNSCEQAVHCQNTSLRTPAHARTCPHGTDSRPNAPAARKGTMEIKPASHGRIGRGHDRAREQHHARCKPHTAQREACAPAARKGTMEVQQASRGRIGRGQARAREQHPQGCALRNMGAPIRQQPHCAPKHRSRSTHRQRVRARAGGHAPRKGQGRRRQSTAHTPHMKATWNKSGRTPAMFDTLAVFQLAMFPLKAVAP